jgi:hypothetical protein
MIAVDQLPVDNAVYGLVEELRRDLLRSEIPGDNFSI